jgi:hypothetical protein
MRIKNSHWTIFEPKITFCKNDLRIGIYWKLTKEETYDAGVILFGGRIVLCFPFVQIIFQWLIWKNYYLCVFK